MLYTIDNGKVKVTVNSFGAELTNIVYNGKERLWQNENGEWDGHAPVLFPYCGRVTVTKFGKDYEEIIHGVAPYIGFALIEKGEDFLKFSACSSKETRKNFPYDFVLEVVYRIKDCDIFIEYEVGNPSDENLYFACGGHESFKIDGELEDYYIEFEKDEHFIDYLNNEDGHLTGETGDLGTGKILDFGVNRLVDERTIILKGINSRKVYLKSKDGKLVAESVFNGFNNLMFWRPGTGRVVCIEPWTNLPDSEGAKSIEFSDKYGVMELQPKAKKKFIRSIRYY